MKSSFFLYVLAAVFLFSCNGSREKKQTPVAAETVSASSSGTEKKESAVSTPSATETEKHDPADSNTTSASGEKTRHSTGEKNTPSQPAEKAAIDLPVSIRESGLGISFRLPSGWKQKGETLKALGRKGEWLNSEAYYADKDGKYELNIKVHPAPNASKIYDFHKKQHRSRKGLFSEYAGTVQVAGQQALYGISLRRFDGKGHKLDPPAKVYAAVWYDPQKDMEYEMIFRSATPQAGDEALFKAILKTVTAVNSAK